MAFNVIGLAISIGLSIVHGQVSFRGAKLTGTHPTVAHKEFHCPKTFCAVSVFFPVDQEATRDK
jgi:hypothetical protein